MRALGLSFLPHHSSTVLRRAAVDRVGGFDESFTSFCEDADFWYRLARELGPGAFKLVDRRLACYRRRRPTLKAQVARRLRGWAGLEEKERARFFELARLLVKHDGWLAAAVPEARV